MGKQSGRLYYNGEDHYDLWYRAMSPDGLHTTSYNHSKIYFGDKLVWKRELPKFLILDDRNLATTEKFSAISDFPTNSFDGKTIIGISSLAKCYFIACSDENMENSSSKIYVSDNGYDWKLIYETENRIIYFGKINTTGYDSGETIVISTKKEIMYCKPEKEKRFNFEKKYEYPEVPYSLTWGNFANCGKRMFVPGRYNSSFGYRSTSLVLESENIYENDYMVGVIPGKESGCFYRLNHMLVGEKLEYYFEKSYDCVTWSYFCRQFINGSDVLEYNGTLCSIETVKIISAENEHNFVQQETPRDAVIDGIAIINDVAIVGYHNRSTKEGGACITDDLFSFYYDGNEVSGSGIEPIKRALGFTLSNDVSFTLDMCASIDKEFVFQNPKFIYA